MKKIFTFITMILTISNMNSQDIKEQIAFDFFFENIFYNEYTIDKLQFSGIIEQDESNFSYYRPCFEDNQFDLGITYQENDIESRTIKTNKIRHVKFKKKYNRYKLYVLRATKEKEFYYVQIEIIKKRQYADSYFFKINKLNEVVEWCKSEVVF